MIPDRCHDIEELGNLAELSAEHPSLAHVRRCAHCRGLLAAYRRFVQGCPEAGDPVREKALGRLLQHELGVAEKGAAPVLSRRGSRFTGLRALVPGLAAAAVLVLFLSFQQYRSTEIEGPSRIDRSDQVTGIKPALHPVAAVTPVGGVRLAWTALPGAENYVIVVYGADLREIMRQDAGEATVLTLSPERLTDLRRAPQPLVWRVLAFAAGDQLAISDPATIPRSGSI